MFWAIVLTFVITALSMTVFFMYTNERKQDMDKNRLAKQNDDLRRKITDYRNNDQARRERIAYDQGMYDARGTDALYRQCLQKYTTKDQPVVMMNDEGVSANE